MKKLLALLLLTLSAPAHAVSMNDIPRCGSEWEMSANILIENGIDPGPNPTPPSKMDDCLTVLTMYNVDTAYVGMAGYLVIVLRTYGESEINEFRDKLCGSLYKDKSLRGTTFFIASRRVIYEANSFSQIWWASDHMYCPS